MDGIMCEDIRLGVMVRVEMRSLYNRMWRKKNSTGPCITFSSQLLEIAGGIRRLFAEWEEIDI